MTKYESIDAWIGRQDWPEATKAEAREMHRRRCQTNLNPLTGSGWAAWAKARGFKLTFGGAK